MFLRFNLGEIIVDSLESWQELLRTANDLESLKNAVRGLRKAFFASGDLHSADFYGRRWEEVNRELFRRNELAKRGVAA